MIPYIITLVLTTAMIYFLEQQLVSGSSFNYVKNNAQRNLAIGMGIVTIVFILMASIRSINTGIDFISYQDYFYDNFYFNIEKGYVLSSWIFYYLNLDFRVFIVFVNVLIYVPVVFVIYKLSSRRWFSLLMYQSLYLYANSFNIIRQSIAMSIILLAIYFLITVEKRSKSYSLYVGFVLLAFMFHVSAIFFLPLFLVKNKLISFKLIVSIVLFSLVFMFFRVEILTFVMKIFSREYYDSFTVEIGYTTIAILLSMLVVSLITVKQHYFDLNPDQILFVNIVIVSLVFNVLWVWFPNHARISMYILLIGSVLFPNCIPDIKKKSLMNFLMISMSIVFVSFYVFQLKYRDYGGVVPYQTIYSSIDTPRVIMGGVQNENTVY